MKFDTLTYEIRDDVAIVTLNRPEKKNALDIPMREELSEVVMLMRNDDSLKAAIITGAGGSFCAGGDLSSVAEKSDAGKSRRRIQNIHVWLHEFVSLELPVIAAVDGPAYGAGFNIALAADFVLATPRARFCQVFGRIGLVPDAGGFFLLPRIVGLQKAKELVFSARSVDAEEAKELGIVYEIHEAEKLMDAAMALAGRFKHASRLAIGLSKNLLNQSLHLDFRAVGEMECFAQAVAHGSEYNREAVQRFLNKEPLRFNWDAAKGGG